MTRGRILGIETSCDETAAAVVERGTHVVSSIISSQIDLHARFGGVVPELASRAHLDLLTPIVEEALVAAGSTTAGDGIDAVAATVGPGLIGALLVGVAHAKALASVWGVPFVGVNHLEAHLYAAALEDTAFHPPLLVLLVSGGHTLLVHVEAHGRYRLLGRTIDDAAGEAFDKVARFLGLGYPGGPAVDRLAATGDPHAINFPRAMANDGLDVSFSGLKTAVLRHVRAHPDGDLADVCASFQEAVVDVLVAKTLRAADAANVPAICLAGGVAANSSLRARLASAGAASGRAVFVPAREMCTDNAAMVAGAGWWQLATRGPSDMTLGADPGLRLAMAVAPA